MPHSAASHLGLYCLFRPACPNTYGKYGSFHFILAVPYDVYKRGRLRQWHYVWTDMILGCINAYTKTYTYSVSSYWYFLPPDPISYLCCLALRIWTSFWRREGSAGMDMWNAPMGQSRQPLTYRLMVSVGLGGPRWQGSSWQRWIAESGSSRLWTLMIDIPGDLVWDLPCVQHTSQLPRRGPTDDAPVSVC